MSFPNIQTIKAVGLVVAQDCLDNVKGLLYQTGSTVKKTTSQFLIESKKQIAFTTKKTKNLINKTKNLINQSVDYASNPGRFVANSAVDNGSKMVNILKKLNTRK